MNAHFASRSLDENGQWRNLTEIYNTQLPFDVEGRILESLKKTNRIIFMDEDVPGGATAY